MKEDQATLYRNVTSSVRTPRFAVFIDKNDKQWKTYVESIIKSFSQTWGGEYFLIIPTDGKTIDDKFWEILEAYSPDKLGKYIASILDLEEADPERYKALKEQYRRAWSHIESDEEFEKTWLREASSANLTGLEISKELAEELRNRLSPFHYSDHVISENVFYDKSLGFPFTQIADIVESAKNRPTKITVPRKASNLNLRLLTSSRSGALQAEYLDTLKTKGFEEITLSTSFHEKDYVEALERGEYEWGIQGAIAAALGDDRIDEAPPKDFLQFMPFRLSMLHLGRYFKRSVHREENESLRVVIGDGVMDFCTYYCLSRLHDGVHWLPETYLRKANSKYQANTTREDDQIKKYTRTEYIAVSLVNAYFSLVGSGHRDKNIHIMSHTLSDRQLATRRGWMASICWSSVVEVAASISVVPLKDVNVECVMMSIEENNYANQQDMIFQDNKSVGRVSTPIPKNFSTVDPGKHRWVTNLEVDGYFPPPLPFLAPEIIKLRPSGYDTRIAKDGLAYLCPNVAYFGGDVDNNVVRPELELLDETEIFSRYFADSGYTMQLSDKGSYLKDTIDRFGSLQLVAEFFREASSREMFGQFLFTKAESDGDEEVIFLDTERRAYLSFEAFNRKMPSSEATTLLMDELIAKDIVRRGLIFQCERCRLTSWYGIEEVSREFECKRCGLVQPYAHKSWKWSDEPRWYYRLAETVYQFYRSSSHLTALTLDKLRQESKVAFHYVCESDIINVLGENKKRELDILAISDGEIIIGECKDCTPKAKDVTKYRTLFSLFKIKPKRFVLATTDEAVSDDVRRAVERIEGSQILTKAEL